MEATIVNKVSQSLNYFKFKQLLFVTFTIHNTTMTFNRNKNRFLFCLMIFAISFGSSGCFIFKKKCDCPSFGKRTEKSVEKSSWQEINSFKLQSFLCFPFYFRKNLDNFKLTIDFQCFIFDVFRLLMTKIRLLLENKEYFWPLV